MVNDGVCYDAMTSKLGTYWGYIALIIITITITINIIITTMTTMTTRQTFADEQICAGGEAGKDACQGDSGGPFVHDK